MILVRTNGVFFYADGKTKYEAYRGIQADGGKKHDVILIFNENAIFYELGIFIKNQYESPEILYVERRDHGGKSHLAKFPKEVKEDMLKEVHRVTK